MERREFLQSVGAAGLLPAGVQTAKRPTDIETHRQYYYISGGPLPVKPDTPYQTTAYLPKRTVDFDGELLYMAGRYPRFDPDGSYPENATAELNGKTIRRLVYKTAEGPAAYKATADISSYIDPGWNELEIGADTKGYLTANIYGVLTVRKD